MGFLSNILTPSAAPVETEKRSWSVLEEITLGNVTAAGVSVTSDKALTLSAVYGCVRILAETVASLPLFVYERAGDGKERAVDHPLYSILHDSPNPLMTAFEFREALMGHLTLWGNALDNINLSCQKEPNARGLLRLGATLQLGGSLLNFRIASDNFWRLVLMNGIEAIVGTPTAP